MTSEALMVRKYPPGRSHSSGAFGTFEGKAKGRTEGEASQGTSLME